MDTSNKSSNQPASRETRPNCYECKYRGCVVYSAHSSCEHPRIKDNADTIVLLAALDLLSGKRPRIWKLLNISGNAHGINSGWFQWPISFDPVWLETCDGFTPKEVSK